MAIIKDQKLLEYALKGMEAERDVIEAQITELRAKLAEAIAPRGRRRARRAGASAKKRRARAVQGVKREVSETLTAAKKTAKKMSVARRKALSEAMKKVWARRKKAGG